MTDIPFDKEFWNDVLRRVVSRTRGYADAEDLLHAAFLRLERYRRKHTVENPAAFLVQTAVNIRIDGHRHEKLSEQTYFKYALGNENNSPLQDEVVVARARLARVKLGLDKLSPRTREVFLMHRMDNLKYSEIATRLGISQSAVEKHVAKAGLFLTEWTQGW
jgi:RNA polymerase sigma factor (sigma-70 family)